VPSKRDLHFIDTNVFIYAATESPFENDNVEKLQAGSQAVIRSLADGQLRGVTSLTVLAEILYLLARWARQRPDPTLYQAGRKIVQAAILLVEEVFAPTAEEFGQIIEEYGPNRDLNDLLIAKTMQLRGLTTIISADRGFENFGLKRADPRQWA
jgi:predicted nucleic acid-binding protein